MSREYTTDEVREMFVEHLRNMVTYWEQEDRAPSVREKLEGFAYSVLVALDGETSLPGFLVAPMPHPDDKQFCIDKGENYFPSNSHIENQVCADIGGSLHDNWYKQREE